MFKKELSQFQNERKSNNNLAKMEKGYDNLEIGL